MIFGIAAVLILLMIFSGVAVPLAFLGGSFFVAYMGLGSTGTFATNAFYILNSISMLAIPLFIVGGSLIERSGIANVLIRVADKMLHNVKGGLTATIPVVSCFFGALCGSALATANTLSTAMVPELEKKGYDKAYLAALIAASSPFGFMIPPNVNAIIFASVSSALVIMFPMTLIFSRLMTLNHIPELVAELMLGITNNRIGLILLIDLLLFFIGFFLDGNVIILTLVPLLTPIATACGIDTIQLAVIVFVSIGIGSITPPMATCLMACSRVCDVPIHKLIKPILPFLLFGALPILLLVSFVPVVSTWLPGLFYSF